MDEYLIVPAPSAFVIKAAVDDLPELTATEQAAGWLARHCEGGFEPLAVLAVGNATRLTLSGAAEGAAIVLRREIEQ